MTEQPEFETVYVKLLNEGTDVTRPTHARSVGQGVYELQPTDNYNSENEKWEFLPSTRVQVIETATGGKPFLLAAAIAKR